jgi:small subunit ribosomal protein S7
MPRKSKTYKKIIYPDSKYNSLTVARFINKLLSRGKKSIAESIIYNAFEIIKEKTKKDPLEIFEKALVNVSPVMEVKSRRVGGSTYQVPVEVKPMRGTSLGMRWLIENAFSRGGKPMFEKLASEIMDAASGQGNSIKKKEDVHKMADSNKAFAHFRW